MATQELLAERFEAHRPHLRAVAYRMLGSLTEADDAVQDAWIRLSRSDTSDVQNLAGWLTTVVGRVCLDTLRSRTARREAPLEEHLPDPVLSRGDRLDPEAEALLADSVGLALLVVLDSLNPAERLAFVLHDSFGVPFEDIAAILERSPAAAKQLASRARRRVQAAAPTPDPDVSRQRRVVEAFLAAARAGDFEALIDVLHPDVLLRADRGVTLTKIRGAAAVAGQALTFARFAYSSDPVLVNGTAGVLSTADGQPMSLMSFTISAGKILAIDIVADPDRLRRLV
ncbi:RNA polymerase sigma factor SigJ [Actinomycetes bacterium KLBMP 9797]